MICDLKTHLIYNYLSIVLTLVFTRVSYVSSRCRKPSTGRTSSIFKIEIINAKHEVEAWTKIAVIQPS